MKKVFILLAIAAMTMVACNKPENGDDPSGEGENKEYAAPIKIDGDFTDWAALGDKVQVVKCAPSSSNLDLKLMKVYGDKYYVFVYLEFDYSAYEAVTSNYLNFIINGDNDKATGGYKGPFDQGETPCVDMLIQGAVIADGVDCEFDPYVGLWPDTMAANSPDWPSPSWTEVENNNFIIGKGSKKAWEFQITRELYPAGKLAKEFGIGALCTVNGWDATGALPNADATETNPAGEADLLTVKYNK
jgi:hypothetical protein